MFRLHKFPFKLLKTCNLQNLQLHRCPGKVNNVHNNTSYVPLDKIHENKSYRKLSVVLVQSVAVPLGRQSLSTTALTISPSPFISTALYSFTLSSCSNYGRTQLKSFSTCSASYKPTSNMSEKETTVVKPFARLPDTVKPKHYNLTIIPNLKTFSFQGNVSIEIEVLKSTDHIILNALDLQITSASLTPAITLTETKLCSDSETVEFHFGAPLQPSTSYTLRIDFTGSINDKMKGLYRSRYTDEAGEVCYAAVTQFESTDARRCFPCWDEPALKATFDVSVKVRSGLEVLGNMPVKRTTELEDKEKGLSLYEFERTPIMSTYLVAMVVGEYDHVEARSSDGVLVRVYTPRGKQEQGLFALEVAKRVLPYYKEYFDIAYPLPKIDLIAIADFSAGAMENWGLVTYRETCLLVDPHNTSAVRKQWIALVVGHELAHQWFGNLVTMEWWTHLWLNEGYASFVEYLCVDHLFPEYDIWTQFVTETYIPALELDALRNSHAIEVPVGHPSEIDEIFDDISYNKGASVIRMLHNYLGDVDFRRGMHIYLTRHQYSNTFTDDLWAALEEASSKPVRAVMSTWTGQQGFPVVRVAGVKYEGGEKTGEKCTAVLSLEQRKFFADGGSGEKCDGKVRWMIPVAVCSAQDVTGKEEKDKKENRVLLEGESCVVRVEGVTRDDWIKVNPGTIGFYRTQYPADMLARFVPAIRNNSLPPLDRLGLLDDLFALVQAGHTDTVQVLRLMRAFVAERDFTVWSSVGNVLTKLRVLLAHTDCETAFAKYESELLSQISAHLGWNPLPGEKHLDTLLRSLVLGRLAWLDDAATMTEANKRFSQHLQAVKAAKASSKTDKDATNDSLLIPADLRSAVYKAVLRGGGEETFEAMLFLYRSADLHEEKDRISRALGATKNEKLLERVLEFAMSDEVRSQDTVFVIMSVAMTYRGQVLAWEFFQSHWQTLLDRYQGGFLLARLVKVVAENFASEARAVEIEQFFGKHKFPGTERTVQQAIETIRLNAAWLARDSDGIRGYLVDGKE